MPTETIEHAGQVLPGSFESVRYWYEKAHNATIHPLLNFFLNLGQDRMILRYCHLHPVADPDAMRSLLNYEPRYFLWAGADLINVTTADGRRQMVVIENNSCPSGQKSMPLTAEHQEQGGYRELIERTFKPWVEGRRSHVEGVLAVVYDKNAMESAGYAACMADIFDEPVYLTKFNDNDSNAPVRFDDGIMYVRNEEDTWLAVRAAFRYVTQRPWNRIPIHTKTRIFNPVIACLAGGRNKLVASKAYDIFNAEIESSGLRINTPDTIWDVSKNEVPIWVRKLGGQAVVKIPYSNAGQGVFTIVTPGELRAFMERDYEYDKFIVQSLIGNYQWGSKTAAGRMYHVGMVPSSKNHTFAFDLRLMLSSTAEGFRPMVVYSRRARKPLSNAITEGQSSWDMLGTNLSYIDEEKQWQTDSTRLLLMDRRDFNSLGLGLDDLIEAYVQTVLSTIAIDKMAQTLFTQKGRFRARLFQSLDDDPMLINEILTD